MSRCRVGCRSNNGALIGGVLGGVVGGVIMIALGEDAPHDAPHTCGAGLLAAYHRCCKGWLPAGSRQWSQLSRRDASFAAGMWACFWEQVRSRDAVGGLGHSRPDSPVLRAAVLALLAWRRRRREAPAGQGMGRNGSWTDSAMTDATAAAATGGLLKCMVSRHGEGGHGGGARKPAASCSPQLQWPSWPSLCHKSHFCTL